LQTTAEFKPIVSVMQSLRRPLKLTVIGSDGREYSFLVKSEDDLRKDSLIMRFNDLVNKLLNTQAPQHQLRIRTYAVVPLNDNCGIIE
jgi:serine/threonine-protein kinase ATR